MVHSPITSADDHSSALVQLFRQSAPYIKAHRHKTFVMMLAGEAVLDHNAHNIIHDLTLLHSLGINIVLVYGARPQINHALQQANIELSFHQQRRITPRSSLPYLLQAVGATRLQIEALFSMGLVNTPMYRSKINVVSGNLITAKPYGIHDGVDYQLSGEVRSVDRQSIQNHLANDAIVLLSPLAYSTTGEVFNVLAEEVAYKTAIALQADKLIFLTEHQHIIDAQQQPQRELNPEYLEPLFEYYQQDKTLTSLLYSAQQASLHGVHRVHFLSYKHNGALLEELFTRDGIGTMMTKADYEDVRMANIADIGGLMTLLQPLEQQGILVYRSRERLEQEIEQFAVIERDGMIITCAALYPIPTQADELASAEIACVAVHPDYRKSHRGTQILEFLQHKAKQQRFQQLFVLTTRTAHWFIEHGFQPCDVDDLPSARQALYNYQRNSMVFIKKIDY